MTVSPLGHCVVPKFHDRIAVRAALLSPRRFFPILETRPWSSWEHRPAIRAPQRGLRRLHAHLLQRIGIWLQHVMVGSLHPNIRSPPLVPQEGRPSDCRPTAGLPEPGERRVSEGFFSASLLTRATSVLVTSGEPSGPRFGPSPVNDGSRPDRPPARLRGGRFIQEGQAESRETVGRHRCYDAASQDRWYGSRRLSPSLSCEIPRSWDDSWGRGRMIMDKRADERHDEALGLNDLSVTRRDFLGGALLGAGAALLGMAAPAIVRAAGPDAGRSGIPMLGADWTGPGGIGDYSRSNGNTHEVVNAAHSIWKGDWDKPPAGATDAGTFDLVVVGGGFAGLMAAHTFNKEGKGTCLLLDNHPIFGGEAKQNELSIDGYRLIAPQGSNGFSWPNSARVWKEIGLPGKVEELQWQRKAAGTNKPLRIPDDSYESMPFTTGESDVGFFYKDPSAPNGHRWVKEPWANGFRDAPLPERVKLELMMMQHFEYREPVRKDWDRWLDSMTYKEFLQKVVGITRKEVFEYLDPLVGATYPGLGSDVISAYTGTAFPGAEAVWKAATGLKSDEPEGTIYASFPGGNSGIARHFVKTILPDAIEGRRSIHDVVLGKVYWQALDRDGSKVRMRLGSTVVRVEHAGSPDSPSAVNVTYVNAGKPYRVKARGVVMASGQWMKGSAARAGSSTRGSAGTPASGPRWCSRGTRCRSTRASRLF
ncbi:MAG: NAD(P)/FAD-dependent oxidoreductase [Chloroflexi bacterium]|nr:MAG: NAD(P)/FAD-dependent oxidoreductase [Chloroflexota bacterium]